MAEGKMLHIQTRMLCSNCNSWNTWCDECPSVKLADQNKELLEALEYLVGECDADMDDDYNPHAAPLSKARTAIAHARGEADGG